MKNTDMTLLLNNPAKLQLRLDDFSDAETEQLFLALMKSEDATVLNKEYDLMRAVTKRLTQEQLVNLAVKYGETQNLFCVYALQQIDDLDILRELAQDPCVGEYARSTVGKRLRGETVELELEYDDGSHGWQIQVYNEWIYYYEYSGSGIGGNPLYKCRTDGTDKAVVISSIAYFQICGDWIYFTNDIGHGMYSRHTMFGKDDVRGKGIFKFHADNNEIIKLCDDENSGFTIADDWIYYCNHSRPIVAQLCKIRTDGTGQTCLLKDYVTNFTVDSGWIYYESKFHEAIYNEVEDGLYRIRLDMTEKTKLTIYEGIVHGDWVYRKYYKFRVNGEFQTGLSKEQTQFMYISAGWIYYIDNPQGLRVSGRLFRMRTDGTDITPVCNDYGNFYCICGIWIYYKISGTDGTLCRVRKDGTGREILC